MFWEFNGHRCSYQKTDGTTEDKKYVHSPDKAGYDVFVIQSNLVECPDCGRIRKYNGKHIRTDFQGYSSLFK